MAVLEKVNYPDDIKNLKTEQLNILAEEIRNFLIENVSKTGGHLASNLGVVELTIAINKVFDLPKDKLIWDVGHQCYVHKILSGRKNRFDTLRMYGGLSGFTTRKESQYDVFGAGHSSTSISAALGLAKARDLSKEKFNVIAVIGDGALTGGMALEALNDAGASNTDLIVILNDNEMSIAQNVGSLATYLSKIRTNPKYITLRDDIETILKKIPAVGNNIYKSMEKIKESVKQLVIPGMLFEDLGFTYLGPIDGHNIYAMIDVLNRAKKLKGPIVIHAITKKGKGYHFAEEQPDVFHGVGPFEVSTGNNFSNSKMTYSDVFGEEIIKEAKTNEKIVAITAAMPDGTGLKKFSEEFPHRFFDVGIAEQHATTFAAGLAAGGLKPVFAVYSTFLQRAYDQVIHDVCLQNLPVVFAIDRAGVVGEDGETHQGIIDISFLRVVPNLTILSPKDIEEFRMMLKWIFKFNKPVAIRYPRGGDYLEGFIKYDDIQYSKWEILKEGKDICIIATGRPNQTAKIAIDKLKIKDINVAHINARFIKPLDYTMLDNIFKDYKHIFTIEDNYIAGGMGSSILEYAAKKEYKGKIVQLGYPDEFIAHANINQLYKKYNLDSEGIYNTIMKQI
ncbi:1-deoxy-D-xylulose-5-phosphate synthase [Caloramator mitchellensis]|uniref:1-deoxy-D-xylulose-5-phosphate synthase n=1 Tax=Caloramator mitchellensis TaxID=908809 RepID=A0A0R3JTM0_CALMK|nr:1-deoxy-D-xylulose-5-phosphate synthase [Caloramator mitchellensis]KRQ86824.1 1-deoxy-D-xylulose-5-phosphate synthase [Caloramator mitchellensis]